MYVSKEEAKRMIDDTPGMIWIDSFNGMTFIHTRPKQITIDEGKRLYQPNTYNSIKPLQKRNIACTYFTYISKESQVSSVFCN